jgi:predicted nucleic acid-binding protein
MKFWDSSAIVPLLVAEQHSSAMTELLDLDRVMVVWWGTPVECLSAFSRLERQGRLSPEEVDEGAGHLRALEDSWIEIQPTESLRSRAVRALGVHGLRAADSLQLAAALSWTPDPTEQTSFVCLDRELAGAARREGFSLPRQAGSLGT